MDVNQSIDYASLRRILDTAEDIYNGELSLAENLVSLINRAVILPNKEIQTPIIVAIALLPSVLTKIAPIIVAYGASGSGKSTLGKIIANLYDVPILAGTSTYASIRNQINLSRWGDESFEDERNTFLVFDDLKEINFTADTFTLFRCGYDRQTERIMIATEKGKNLEFRCFCPKLFSTVSAFIYEARYEELVRRSFIVHCKRAHDDADLLDINDISMGSFASKFTAHWRDLQNCSVFLENHRYVRRDSSEMTPAQFTISKSVIVNLVHFGLCADNKSAIQLVEQFWRINKAIKSPLHIILSDFIATFDARYQTALLNDSSIEYSIDGKMLRMVIDTALKSEQLDCKPKPYEIREVMNELGFTQGKSKQGKIEWLKKQ